MSVVEEILCRYVSEVVGLDPSRVRPEARLDDLGLDSVGRAEVFMSVSEALDVDIPVDLLGSIETVGDLCGWVERWCA